MKKIEVVVVGKDLDSIRCIYINDTRVVGSKPYYSEHLKHVTLKTSVENILHCIDFKDLEKAYLKRKG